MRNSFSGLVAVAPQVIPPDWREVDCTVFGSMAWECANGLFVIASVSRESDGLRWYHVSVSREGRIPFWKDLQYVKDIFIGKKRKAIQILPPADEHVNVHPYCLHLWTCLDKDPLPDFRVGGEI